MNLKALFNINYFKENIRKSKGLLAFLLGIIPLLNIIYLIILITSKKSNLLYLNNLSIITYIGIIFIPLALSITLFGFVFKRKSVDFIMSKPINRKTIFITNTIGGILILLIFSLINTLIFGLFSLIFNSITIPFALLIDYFILWFISYTFIFVVINLAISLTGNLITSLVVLLLIVLIVPYFNIVNNLIEESSSKANYVTCNNDDCKPTEYYCYGDTSCEEHLKNNEYRLYYNEKMSYKFIAPLSIANEDLYNNISIIKMIILSIIYGFVGYLTFKKRKMENNETSFKSNKIHQLIKGLTLIPICFITYVIIISTDTIGWLISVVGIIIYSFVYDLITRKEITRPLKTIIISLIIFICFYSLYYLKFDVLLKDSKAINNINSITYKEMEITDKKTINYILKSILTRTSNQYSYNDLMTFETDNKLYKVDASINEELSLYLNNLLNNWQKENSYNFNYQKVDYIIYNNSSIPITNKIKKLLNENKNNINEFNYSNLEESEKIYIYSYQNHKYEELIIPIKLSQELYNEIIIYQNNQFINLLEKTTYKPYYQLQPYDNNIFTEEQYNIFNYVINSNKNAFIDYLKNNNQVTMTEESLNVVVYFNETYTVTISNPEKFKEEFLKYQEKVKDEKEYINLINSYKNIESYE